MLWVTLFNFILQVCVIMGMWSDIIMLFYRFHVKVVIKSEKKNVFHGTLTPSAIHNFICASQTCQRGRSRVTIHHIRSEVAAGQINEVKWCSQGHVNTLEWKWCMAQGALTFTERFDFPPYQYLHLKNIFFIRDQSFLLKLTKSFGKCPV